MTEGKCQFNFGSIEFEDYETSQLRILEPIYVGPDEEWKRWRGADLDYPTVDHTTHTEDGHFYGIDFAQMRLNDTKRRFLIQSRTLPEKAVFCFRFSYLIDNLHPKSSLVYGFSTSGETTIDPVWSVDADTNRLWFTHESSLAHFGDWSLSMAIDTEGDSETGKVFIDDVSLQKGECLYNGECTFEVSCRI